MSEQEVFDALRYRIETNDSGSRFYLNSAGEVHRTDGPAIIHADGTKLWYQNDQCHRTDGPAIEWTDGTKSWYQNGKRHRIDGPAIEYSDGNRAWFIYGENLSEDEFNQAVNQNA